MLSTILLAVLLPLVSAHFRMVYPPWRGDSLGLSKPGENNISQWNYPCAGIGQETSGNNRTLWPLTGGAVAFNSSHAWALSYINLGLGNVVNSFNVTLVPLFNETGAGVLCLPEAGKAALAKLNITEGTNATIQVITTATNGAGLFNCADITFSASAPPVSGDVCKNATGVSVRAVGNLGNSSTNGTSNGTSSGGSGSGSGATQGVVPMGVMILALAMGIAASLS